MNFLIDANLPRRLVYLFHERGHKAIHTLELSNGNTTLDAALWIILMSRIVSSRPRTLISVQLFGYKTAQINYY